ncbi:MAG TPA: GNAT family N-acetyltransferase [Myxococcaceae bacterium]|jgi:ribosomal protein S18 acetylase RimI-like enzyme|nr:GNAT family N-acetyltransferase [Myxococcaceae bacterium]
MTATLTANREALPVRVRAAWTTDLLGVRQIARADRFTAAYPGRSLGTKLEEHVRRGLLGVAELDGRLHGFVFIRPTKREGWTKLYWLAVWPSSRRQGVGTALLAYAWQRAPHDLLCLQVDADNADAIAFYRARGFEEYGRLKEATREELLMSATRPREPGG